MSGCKARSCSFTKGKDLAAADFALHSKSTGAFRDFWVSFSVPSRGMSRGYTIKSEAMSSFAGDSSISQKFDKVMKDRELIEKLRQLLLKNSRTCEGATTSCPVFGDMGLQEAIDAVANG